MIGFTPGKRVQDRWIPTPFDANVSFLFHPLTKDELRDLAEKATTIEKDLRGREKRVFDRDLFLELVAEDGILGWKGVVDTETKAPIPFSKEHLLDLMNQVPQIGVWIDEETNLVALNIIEEKKIKLGNSKASRRAKAAGRPESEAARAAETSGD